MKSVTKREVNNEIIELILKKHLGSDAKLGNVTELTEGWFNSAYALIEENSGLELVLKVSPRDNARIYTYEFLAMEVEAKVYELFKDQKEIPLPKIYGQKITSKGDEINFKYILMEKVNGETWSKIKKKLSKETNVYLRRKLSEFQKKMNEMPGEYFGSLILYDNKIKTNNWKDAFYQMVEILRNDYNRLNEKFPRSWNVIFENIDKCEQYLNEIEKPMFVNWDLWEGNAIIKKINGQYEIQGLIDFERALWGDPIMEFLFWRYDKSKIMTDVYNIEFKSSKSLMIRRILYNIYLYMIWYLESFTRGYPKMMNIGLRFMSKFLFKRDIRRLNKLLLSN